MIKDLRGITHRFEGGLYHNTRCGRREWSRIGGRGLQIRATDCHMLYDGVVDCMTCLVGPTRLTAHDLVLSPEIEILVRLVGVDGSFVSGEREVTLRQGACKEAIVYDDTPIGVVIAAVAYLTYDGDELHRNGISLHNFKRHHEEDTLHLTLNLTLS